MSYFILLQAHFGHDCQGVKPYNPNANKNNLWDLDLIKLKLQNPTKLWFIFLRQQNKYIFQIETNWKYMITTSSDSEYFYF
jgi:hypothetical protein